MENADERKVFLYVLLPYMQQLSRFHSFSACVDRCNFTVHKGWKGKTYIDEQGHGVDEYKPAIRGIELFDVYYIKPTDYVILTEEQYRDFELVIKVND